ncbi:protein O-glucosyltransferase 2-like isoform X2 [Dendronephthya gigantea]|uniref:protein O-glucosyltransferase 2-like isoform X2 n=1 Tax=Dendronephthya gigantea TaxID=151771 RepID=UPI00106DC3D0|nr:protein O-glucosyltransferase 2-like isoform X2 [Dendronephthya gigantea]
MIVFYRNIRAVVVISCYLVASCALSASIPNAKKTKVWGPGLRTDIVLPARYFFIHAADKNGKLLKESPGDNTFQVELSRRGGDRVRAWRQVLDRHDGSFLVLYRAYESVDELFINVKYNGKDVAESPYVLQEFYHENCDCPQKNSSVWSEAMGCPATYKQIDKDLAKFKKIDRGKVAKEAIERFGQHHALVHYRIIKNKIYRKTFGKHVGFAQFMDSWLYSLMRKVKLPNVEFFVNLGDWPLEKRRSSPLPIFSWCGSEDSEDIVMPTYDITQSVTETLGRISLSMQSVQANTGPKWQDKIPKAFWRGRDSRQERLDFVVMARKKPELYDAALTNFFFFPYDEAKYGPKGQHVSFYDFFKYKYQITIDGTVAAYRLPYLLAGDSVVFKQDSEYYEHFYKELEPWVHYIPFKRDLSDLEPNLNWAMANDKKAEKIALQAREYVRERLTPEHIYCYYYVLLKKFAKLQKTKPKEYDDMEFIAQPTDDKSSCECKRKKKKAKSHDEL